MSNKKTKSIENNENLCPSLRKRNIASSPVSKTSHGRSSWKLAKLETTSSPGALTVEYLEEMGIGVLESEESSSSAASAIALAVSLSSDEISNEATPNLDAPKFCHQQLASTSLNRTLDNSLLSDSCNNANRKYFEPNVHRAEFTNGTVNINTNNNYNNNSFEVYKDEMQPPQCKSQQQNLEEKWPEHKKLTMPNSVLVNMPINTAVVSGTLPLGLGRCKPRSPLATVPSNSFPNNVIRHQQYIQPMSAISPTHFNYNNTLQCETLLNCGQPLSPSQPSTSQQAALMRQQRELQAEARKLPAQLNNDENFFIYRKQYSTNKDVLKMVDPFSRLSDEIILHIFKWLPKKALLRCCLVNRRFARCACDESLWTRLDLGGRSLRSGALENVLTRGVVILRLAQTEIKDHIFDQSFLQNEPRFETKLQYLDLSMATISKTSLKVLLTRCRHLKKLSLEHVPVNDEICNEIAKNQHLEALNLAMCLGLEAWSIQTLLESLQNLCSLNISWTGLSVDAVSAVVTYVTPNIMRLNIAGCRKTMFDSHLATLAKRCPELVELDLSDCTGLTGNVIALICKFNMLEYLSLSRCYLIPASALMELSGLHTLTFLDVFGMLSDAAMEMLEQTFPALGINKYIHSSVARPTVGTRRTSIWGLRTRD